MLADMLFGAWLNGRRRFSRCLRHTPTFLKRSVGLSRYYRGPLSSIVRAKFARRNAYESKLTETSAIQPEMLIKLLWKGTSVDH